MARAQDDTRRLWHVLVHTVLSTRRLPSGSFGQTAAGLLAPVHSPNIASFDVHRSASRVAVYLRVLVAARSCPCWLGWHRKGASRSQQGTSWACGRGCMYEKR